MTLIRKKPGVILGIGLETELSNVINDRMAHDIFAVHSEELQAWVLHIYPTMTIDGKEWRFSYLS